MQAHLILFYDLNIFLKTYLKHIFSTALKSSLKLLRSNICIKRCGSEQIFLFTYDLITRFSYKTVPTILRRHYSLLRRAFNHILFRWSYDL